MPKQPTLGAGWMPMPQPAPARSTLWPTVTREVAIFGALTIAAAKLGVLSSPLWVPALLLARALLSVLATLRGQRISTLVTWVGVAILAVIVSGTAPTPPKITTPQLKSPIQVEASQTDQLAQIRQGVANLWEQLATGFPDPKAKLEEGDR